MSILYSLRREAWSLGAALWVTASVLVAPCAHPAESQPADVLIRGGTLIDGSGAARRRADVAIRDGRILAIGQDLHVSTRSVVDAQGLIVSPGFIDAHSHSDPVSPPSDGVADATALLNERVVRQGVTTVVGGPDGEISPHDLKSLLQGYAVTGIGTNVAFYVGHNAIRTEVMGSNQDRAPTPEELKRMCELVREGMQAGMLGLSTGLMYPPGLYSDIDEVVALAKEVTPFQGVYESHVRDPHRALLQSNWEAIEVGRRAGIAIDLTHLTTPGKEHKGLMKAAIEQIEQARREGVTVVADQYPYHAVATMQLWAVLNYPSHLNAHNRAAIRAALKDPKQRALIREETVSGGASGYSQLKASGASSLLILNCPGCEAFEGRFVSEIASQRRVTGFDAVADLLTQSAADIVVSAGGFYEEDMRDLMRQPWTMIASDGMPLRGSQGGFGSSHPRSTGTFPRVLGTYVREFKLLTLEEGIRKMTSAPADFLGLKDRGRLVPGAAADLVLFDAEHIRDRSTWKDPLAAPEGIDTVIVNGVIVWKDQKMLGTAPGRFLRRERPRDEATAFLNAK